MSVTYVCPGCGLDYDTVAPGDALAAVRSFPRRYRALLISLGPDDDAVIRQRPEPGTWSPLEYTAHVADTTEAFAPAIRRMMAEDHPTISFFDSDERVVTEAYNEQARDDVLGRLDRACADLAEVMEGVDPGDWARTAQFDWGDRDALDTARNAVHEGSHHLRDVERGLEAARR